MDKMKEQGMLASGDKNCRWKIYWCKRNFEGKARKPKWLQRVRETGSEVKRLWCGQSLPYTESEGIWFVSE